MDFRLLGPIEAERTGGGTVPLSGSKVHTVLAALLLAEGRVVSDTRLAALLWAFDPPATADAQIYTYMSRLRKHLGEEVEIVRRRPGYVLRAPGARIDLAAFTRLSALGRAALAERRFEDAATLLREALGLWRGTALANATEELIDAELPRLEEARMIALESRIEAELALGRPEETVAELTGLVAEHPVRERLRAQLMTALYRCGRQADALHTYHEGRALLADRLGVDPGEALGSAYRSVLKGDGQGDARAARAAGVAVARDAGGRGAGGRDVGGRGTGGRGVGGRGVGGRDVGDRGTGGWGVGGRGTGGRGTVVRSSAVPSSVVPSSTARASTVPGAAAGASTVPSSLVRSSAVPSSASDASVVRASAAGASPAWASTVQSSAVRSSAVPGAVAGASTGPSSALRSSAVPDAVAGTSTGPSSALRSSAVSYSAAGASLVPGAGHRGGASSVAVVGAGWVVPAGLPSSYGEFVGRRSELAVLHERLGREDHRPRRLLITGPPGAGKTALAVRAAHDRAARFPDGQLYVELCRPDGTPRDPAEVLVRLLRALGDAPPAAPDDLEELVRLYRTRTSGARLLLVLDGAVDDRQLAPLLPGAAEAAVLVTGQTRLARVAGADTLALPLLDDPEARELLGSLAGGDRLAAEPDATRALVTYCAGLPLALSAVGARLAARPHWPVARLAARLADPDDRLDELAYGDVSVRESLLRSVRRMDRTTLDTVTALAGPAAPWATEAFSAREAAEVLGAPEDEVEDALEALVERALLPQPGLDGDGRPLYRRGELVRLLAAALTPCEPVVRAAAR
ncbi:AfsR/SARP family transcriptional regulator [Streptomyces venezuelae]|uniref:AfsR/SARP family transcriptional regulator n=1 Tax=Streptomyces venezuelae TaxID=54571 RepID=UPI0037D8EA2B